MIRRTSSVWLVNLLGFLLILAVFGSCTDDPTSEPNTVLPQFPDLEQDCHDYVNIYRADQGLSPLAWDDQLAAIARQHSINIAGGIADFGHEDFMEVRVPQAKSVYPELLSIGENVAGNTQSPADAASYAVTQWIESEGHRENLVGNYNMEGIGVAFDGSMYYFTQVLIRN
jgi:uncharacterized protein YkwD